MGTGFEHAALAVFTTLAPMGAAAFLALTYAFFSTRFDEAETKRIDVLTVVPAVVVLAGFVGAFLHLASPGACFGVFGGIGSSPLSNEIVVALLFCVVAVVYWAMALCGKLPSGGTARRVFLVILSALALVFAVFCGLAYMMVTIPTWNSPMSVVQMLGFAIAAGAVLGFAVLALAKVDLPNHAPKFALVLVLVGVAVGAIGLCVQFAGLGGICNIWGSAAELVPAFGVLIAVFVVCGIASAVLVYFGLAKKMPTFTVIACLIVAIGVFFARIAFYGTYMGLAL